MAQQELRSKASEKPDAERLLIEAAREDPARFAELYESNFVRVYAFIARRVRDRSETEDLTAEVFHHALAALPRFEWRGAPFAAWLFKIASNAIIDRSKRAAKEQQAGILELSTEANPLEIDEESEQRAWLFQLVEGLPVDQRRVVSMRFAEEKSIREIANELGRSEGAVKQLQFRALENLRAQMRPESGDTDG
ncbi:MAG TPA: sigma-70 family RNA polymerase sigma factor [Blastocatellia bacterium]|nr:sigma-70 family RNA polymerase sigma factor [Blastocatellia bacterium]